eukprot:485842-Amphidinium_carterae.1
MGQNSVEWCGRNDDLVRDGELLDFARWTCSISFRCACMHRAACPTALSKVLMDGVAERWKEGLEVPLRTLAYLESNGQRATLVKHQTTTNTHTQISYEKQSDWDLARVWLYIDDSSGTGEIVYFLWRK